ncbi:MAG: DUF7452 domain-containing protein [Chitinophagales bacterium]
MQSDKAKKPLDKSQLLTKFVSGRNVNHVEFGTNGRNLGTYKQVGEKAWVEMGTARGASSFRFEEVKRDQWSVYLQDLTRSTYIQLDLRNKKVLYGGKAEQAKRPIYDILSASDNPPTKPQQPEGKPSLELVNGKNVNYVEFGRNNGKLGVYRQFSAKMWKEIAAAKGGNNYEFREMNRDEWSVYLKDESRGVSIQLDLHTKKVMYSDPRSPQKRPLYDILKSSAKVNGWLAQEVTYSGNKGVRGKFVQKDGKGWVEVDLVKGKTIFNFTETQRDDWSVYLFDKSRNAHVQLDLHTNQVMFATNKAKKRPIYNIVDAKSVKESKPIVITKPTDKPRTPPIIAASVPQVFSHTTAKSNTTSNSTWLNHTKTNNNPNAIVFVTPNWKDNYNPTAIGVYMHGDKWRIFNQDRKKNLPENYRFNVLAYPQVGKNVFVHQANKSNIFGNQKHITRIKHPYSDGDKNAKLIVTQNYGTQEKGVYNNHPIGVYYNKGYWTIYNQDKAPMPENARFNVLILKNDGDVGMKGAKVMNHKAGAGSLAKGFSHVSLIDSPLLNGNSDLFLFATSSWNTSIYNTHPTGVYYHSGKWSVYNDDKQKMPQNAYFNILAINPKASNSEVVPPKGKSPVRSLNSRSLKGKTRTRIGN